MKGFKNFLFYILVFVISFYQQSLAFAQEPIDNYVLGMTVTRTYGGDYNVRIKFQNDTDEKYKLKDLGNNSYALILPQVKSIINENEVVYENEHDDIKIVFSEKKDITDKNKLYTKINFKTKNESFIKIQAFATRAEKTQIVLHKTPEEIENSKDNSLPDWVWYIPVGILSSICLMLMARTNNPDDEPETKITGRPDIPVTERNSFFKSITPSNKTFSWKQRNPENDLSDEDSDEIKQTDNIDENKTILSTEKQEDTVLDTSQDDDVNKLVDELVKIVIPQNDLVLMPGVPELPGLSEKLFEQQSDNSQPTKSSTNVVIPETMSLSERLKNTDLIKEADEIIFSEKDSFFDNISPIKDIPKEIIKKEDIGVLKTEEFEVPDLYDNLIQAYKKILTIAHKIKENENPEIDIIDAFAINDNVGFCLVKYGSKISLVGNISEKVFLIKTFNPDELDEEPLFMEFCTQTPTYSSYSVILNKFKALIKVSVADISLIGEYD